MAGHSPGSIGLQCPEHKKKTPKRLIEKIMRKTENYSMKTNNPHAIAKMKNRTKKPPLAKSSCIFLAP